ncbi:ankyrin-3-like isoform X3 [Tribolium madens]|uniref:ankyrin-3-like isoform X3 n=1 Tax=Tribolium madens TaxID=41895 RepID=UPI001CF74C0E|nr:ankyrin-3-like isoform X3 [Tribolium madens]
MALGNGSTPNGGVTQEKAPVVNGTNMETLPRAGKQTDPNTAFLRAARANQLDKIQEYLDSGTVRDINTSNANGLNALHLAAKDGHVEIARELLKRGAIVDAATKKGNTALHIASLAGQEEIVRLLVQHGASLNVQSQNGFTPLYMAAQENHDGVVKYLLSKGANQTLATEDGFTPLAVAMQQGHDKVVAVLLENDTRGKVRLPALHIAAKKDDVKAAALLLQNEHNPDVTSKSGFTPLHIAAHYGNDKVASLLYDKGADVNYAAKHNITPLHVASKWGKNNMVTLLVAKGADIQAKTRDGLTPLHCAARSGHDQVVDMLLENGAPMHAKTKNGLAPLHMAAQGEHVDAARILLYHGAPVDEVTVDYLTALHVAAHCGHVRVAKLLLDRGADPNARALNGFTPLHIACKKNRIKMVELLLKHGASIGATTESGLTPLHVASFMGCMNIVIYLLQHDASPDIPTVRGETPLHLAARANQTDIIRILLRNGAAVDAKAREEQTPLHVASRLGNVDIVMLLLQHGAQPHATTKDLYTPLHIAAKEGQEEVASVLLDHGADLTATTKKGFTPLHLAAKYGHLNVARLLLQRDAPADAQGKNGVTPLHVAAHYDHQPVALLLLDKGASPHAVAKNGHTPLHIAARKNQMDIATTLLEYGAQADAESKAGFTPLHLSAQEGHSDMSSLLMEHQADPNHAAKNGLTPLHLCAQEDRVSVAQLLLRAGAQKDVQTKAGYTPLHVACHHGHVNMVRLLIEQGAEVNPVTNAGYTPLHQAAQQGHVLVISLLLKNKANPNAVTQNGQTALGIANKLGYISVVEELKVVTETNITTTTTVNIEEKYKVMAPEAMQETFMSDSEDEGGGVDEPPVAYGRPTHAQHVYLPFYQGHMTYTRDDPILGDQQQYKYMTVDDMKSLGDDSMRMDVTRDEKSEYRNSMAPSHISNELIINPTHVKEYYTSNTYSAPDNVDINRQPITVGFLVSFLVDARGGAMRGCRHSGVRVIVPPRCASSPTRITCRYIRPQKTPNPPPLMEGEALASRLLELGPVSAKFLGPVIIEVPHFASLRGKQREIVVLRSDNGETWKEHTLEANEEAIQDVLNHSFDGEGTNFQTLSNFLFLTLVELSQIEDLHTNRITRILTNDFPHYFAVVSRIRQEIHAIGPDGGTVSSSAVPLVQAVFPPNALTKKIRVGLQAQAIEPEFVSKLLGHGVAVSPIVTVEPRRRKFHKAITLSMPAPRAHSQGMINQYSGSAPTLRLLCSITGGQNKAVWEDVTGSTPLTFVKDCVSFTTTVSARFWLMDCRNVSDAARMATDLYNQAAHVPFMAKFVVFAKRVSLFESRIRVFCMTDDKEDKTLEHQEHFVEIAKSRDIEVLENKDIFMEFAGNLVPVLQSGEQPRLGFKAFRENRSAFTMRLRDPDEEPVGRIVFMSDSKVAKGEPNQTPLCTLNLVLPKEILPDRDSQSDLLSLDVDNSFLHHGGISKPDTIHRADFRISDICNLLDEDWVKLAAELDITPTDIALIKEEYPNNNPQQAMIMFRLWLRQKANKATGNKLELALKKIGRPDIVSKCICNVELVTDDMEKALAKVRLDQSGFDTLKDELGSSRDTSLKRNFSLSKASQEELDKSDRSNDFHNQNSTDKDVTDTTSDHLSMKKDHKDENQLDNRATTPNANHDEVLEEITQQLTNLQTTHPKLNVDTNANTPPPSPAEFHFDKEANFTNQIHPVKGTTTSEIITSTPLKTTNQVIDDVYVDPIAVLKKNVSDTLTFLHQERNDFLPEDDIIIPSRKDDHISRKIDLDSINLKNQKKTDDLKNVVQSEVDNVIKKAECVVNELTEKSDNILDDSLDNLESLKDDSISNAQEAFKFLENEISGPPTPIKDESNKFVTFFEESNKSSAIPIAKPRQIEKEKDIDLLFSLNGCESVSPTTNDDLLSKIPIKGGKVKTIKKHSKDPLKEFVKLAQEVNWDDSDDNITEKLVNVTSDHPIVKTTPTRITTEPITEKIKSKIPVLHTETLSPTEITERYEISPKSKIPILKTETTFVETTVVSPGSKISTKSSTLDSDSDDDSPRSPPLKGILKKTVGSSSGSDVALHEEGAELSESETEDLYQQDQPQFSETVTEEIDPVTGAKITRTIRTVSQTLTSPGGRSEEEMRQSMQNVLDQFMSEERSTH